MEGRYRYRLLSCETGTGKKTPGGAGTHTGHTCETGRVNLSVSFVAVPRAHHRLKGRLRIPSVNTSTLSTRSLGLLNFSLVRSVSPSTQGDLWCSLPDTTGRDCDRQSGGGWGEGGQ